VQTKNITVEGKKKNYKENRGVQRKSGVQVKTRVQTKNITVEGKKKELQRKSGVQVKTGVQTKNITVEGKKKNYNENQEYK
jgi:hypothetical protein